MMEIKLNEFSQNVTSINTGNFYNDTLLPLGLNISRQNLNPFKLKIFAKSILMRMSDSNDTLASIGELSEVEESLSYPFPHEIDKGVSTLGIRLQKYKQIPQIQERIDNCTESTIYSLLLNTNECLRILRQSQNPQLEIIQKLMGCRKLFKEMEKQMEQIFENIEAGNKIEECQHQLYSMNKYVCYLEYLFGRLFNYDERSLWQKIDIFYGIISIFVQRLRQEREKRMLKAHDQIELGSKHSQTASKQIADQRVSLKTNPVTHFANSFGERIRMAGEDSETKEQSAMEGKE